MGISKGRGKLLHTGRGKGSTASVSNEMSNNLEEITNSPPHGFVLKPPEQSKEKGQAARS